MKRILLASGSPRRKELLTQMGCVFEESVKVKQKRSLQARIQKKS